MAADDDDLGAGAGQPVMLPPPRIPGLDVEQVLQRDSELARRQGFQRRVRLPGGAQEIPDLLQPGAGRIGPGPGIAAEEVQEPLQEVRVDHEVAGTRHVRDHVAERLASVAEAMRVGEKPHGVELFLQRLDHPGLVGVLDVARYDGTGSVEIGQPAVAPDIRLEAGRGGRNREREDGIDNDVRPGDLDGFDLLHGPLAEG